MAMANLQSRAAWIENSRRLDDKVKNALLRGDITTTSLFGNVPQTVVESLAKAQEQAEVLDIGRSATANTQNSARQKKINKAHNDQVHADARSTVPPSQPQKRPTGSVSTVRRQEYRREGGRGLKGRRGGGWNSRQRFQERQERRETERPKERSRSPPKEDAAEK